MPPLPKVLASTQRRYEVEQALPGLPGQALSGGVTNSAECRARRCGLRCAAGVFDNDDADIVPKGSKSRPQQEDVDVEGDRGGKLASYKRKMPRRKAKKPFLK